ncbi:MAG: DUF917 domain-containing protein [Hornefia butyriciproducens]|uniref:DUF917 domain-containing protein n=1 Tax=Clostridia TaxID=186801 RepID=UPI0004893D0D|nr:MULTISPECIES: DUF917 domain-containing protein [Eubacteriales]MDY2990314.1 DUF917 domain-containing protein [Hornefia butyriciproducens]
MATMYLENRQMAEDFVRGCTFMGTGGGGLPANGLDSLMSEIEKGTKVGWIDADDIPDEATTACPFLMGSIAPHTPEIEAEMTDFGYVNPNYSEKEMLAKAIEYLGKFCGTKIDAVVPIELGGANTPGGVTAGIVSGAVCVDGDYTGRAIPEIQQTTPYLHGKTLWPVASVDAYNDISYIEKAKNYRIVERLGKKIAESAYGLVGQAGFIMSGKEMRECINKGTLSTCYNIGKMIREAREGGQDPVKSVLKELDGYLLAAGTVSNKETWDDGYYYGYHTIEGTGVDAGNTFKIFFKNENHVMWKNEKPYVSSPDIITVVDAKTGEPYANPILKVGDEVCVIGLKANPVFRSEKGVAILGPRYFKFDFDYVPIEETVK